MTVAERIQCHEACYVWARQVAMGVRLIYTTGVNEHEAFRALPNIIRRCNERIDRNSGRRLVEHVHEERRLVEAVRVGRREEPAAGAS